MADNAGPLRRYLRWWGGALRGRVRLLTYERLGDPARLADGAYVFADLERLPQPAEAAAVHAYERLQRRGERVRLINRPGAALRRRQLLRTLHERGLNPFNVYRLDENLARIRYPVFLRNSTEHTGPLSPLLGNAAALKAAVPAAVAAGTAEGDLLVVEFFDTSEGGEYRKYAVMKVGPQLIAQHLFFDSQWSVKATTIWPPERVALDNAFMAENPHADAVAEIFAIAGIEFGRIDYAVREGRIVTFEINTVPTILLKRSWYGADRLPGKLAFAGRLNAALAALDPASPPPSLGERLASYRDLYF